MARNPKLSADQIVQCAIELLDREGPRRFSMRKLAALFDVDPMALYHHVPNRAALMYRVVDTVMADCELPEASGSWQEDAKVICRAFRQLAHRHPGVIRVFDEFEDWVPAEHRITEAMYATLSSGGFTAGHIVRGARLLISYTENFCVWELTDWIAPYTPEMKTELSDSLAQGQFPLTTKLIDQITDVDPDAEFEFGLRVMVRGLEASRESV
ncbi:MAG: hypothetical protein CMO26_21345 [Thiotrichales bacterium]|nr:hypothetical protein [Thiotrichales bacterium]